MKKILVYFGIASTILCMSLPACSKEGEVESEKVKIEDLTDHAPGTIEESIQTPINKAHKAKNILENRMGDIDENLKNQ